MATRARISSGDIVAVPRSLALSKYRITDGRVVYVRDLFHIVDLGEYCDGVTVAVEARYRFLKWLHRSGMRALRFNANAYRHTGVPLAKENCAGKTNHGGQGRVVY